MEEKILFWAFLFVVSFVPGRNYSFKISNLRTRIRCESGSMLRMSMLMIFSINDVSGVVLMSLFLTVNIFQTLFYLLTLSRQGFAIFKLKRKTFLKTRSCISCVMHYFECEQNLLTNSIWTYAITTLWVNQWEIFATEFTSDVDSG